MTSCCRGSITGVPAARLYGFDAPAHGAAADLGGHATPTGRICAYSPATGGARGDRFLGDDNGATSTRRHELGQTGLKKSRRRLPVRHARGC